MKAVIVFVLLFASVFCHPVKRSASSSESSEEVVRPAPVIRRAPLRVTMKAAEPAPPADSDESPETSEETEESNTASDDSTDSTDSTDSADSADSVDTEESETEESISESTESGEAPTAATTGIPVSMVVPTFPVYTDSGRGDNMGYADYKKSVVYEQSNVVEKEPSPYKSYEKMGLNLVSKKSGATFDDGAANDVEKTLKVYKVYTVLLPLHGSRSPALSASALPVSKLSPVSKPTALSRPKALQVHEEILEEDTSTPEVDSQGLDTSSGAQEAGSPKQAVGAPDDASLDSSSSAASEGPASQSESQSQSEEEAAAADGASASSADSNGTSESESASASQEEDESESSQSSEEGATATPGAADSDESDDSDESNSSSEEQGPEPTSEAPILVITAK